VIEHVREKFSCRCCEAKRLRNERSRPLVAELETWLRERRAKLSGQSETGKAIDYSLKRWAALARFLDDGRLCMSSNAAERALRGIAGLWFRRQANRVCGSQCQTRATKTAQVV